jgi:hypothetical protein
MLESCGRPQFDVRAARKEKMRRKRDREDFRELFGGTGDMQKRRLARMEIQWKDWTHGSRGVVG